ncbi:MAG TPA: hypothetical protein VFQ81_02905 [Candidatus Limnocylindria bacterium]|nr:hypothetical protein [Candidatus Limnocylindria bacterium]
MEGMQARGYEPGRCNIGPAEIRARRLSGHVGLAATIGVVAALILFGADPAWRLLAFIPAAGGAGGYLQAAMRFCANFGWRGVFNFTDRIHDTTEVTDAAAAAADRRKALLIMVLSALTGLVVAVGAYLLPI